MEITSIEAGASRCRFSAHAVVGGAIVELVSLSLLMMLAGGVGLWRTGILDAAALSGAVSALAIWAGVSWIIAAFLGGFVAAIASRSIAAQDGLLHGLLAWATACLTGALLGCIWFMAALGAGIAKLDVVNAMDNRMMLAFFVGDKLALIAALIGGRLGARQEARHPRAVSQQQSAGFHATPKPV